MIYKINILLFACCIFSAFSVPIDNKHKRLKIDDSQKEPEEKLSNDEDNYEEFYEDCDKIPHNIDDMIEFDDNGIPLIDTLSVANIISTEVNTLLLQEVKDCMVPIKKLYEVTRIIFNEGDEMTKEEKEIGKYNRISVYN
ncbi:uncharacterized protein LOC126894077 [Daktulosphaira vitifoliae]|uniref:uncharacterized protein LOC126894077 n=1 Tax=Daktulosphaira vitifoliae TaxID=58002 RepID=UPI0021AA3B19|nr:uncharacterized protein LOC126894077 [Daktulosphaira vitifoliae]